jgi:hypothetical protein
MWTSTAASFLFLLRTFQNPLNSCLQLGPGDSPGPILQPFQIALIVVREEVVLYYRGLMEAA